MDSILTSIKQMLGLTETYQPFDAEITMHINSAFVVLSQLGVGPKKPFFIRGAEETWNDFFGTDYQKIEMVKSYMYLKVRLLYDPPSTGVLHEAMERQISEFEWRLNVQAETPEDGESDIIEEGGDCD